MLSFDEAQTRVLALGRRLESERTLASAALGRVLAEDVRAQNDSPGFDASMMDGYAVRAVDVAVGASMPVVGESRAGSGARDLAARSACRIFTGAPMPRGADAVVMQEDATREGDAVRFGSVPAAGAFVRKRGDDLHAGDVALQRGSRIGPAQLSLLASLDIDHVVTSRAPRVTIIPTGDELRAVGATAGDASIAESNSIALVAMASRAFARTMRHPPIADDLERAKAIFDKELRECDVMITIGGVSVGDHDVVKTALEASGVSLDFWRVALKPGKPLAVGKRGDTIVLGLPGNPVSALVTFALFGVPLLRAMQGDTRPLPRKSRGRLATSVTRKPGRLELARARIDERGDVALLPRQASAAIIGLCNADVLACIPRDAEHLDAGTEIETYAVAELGLV